MYKLVSILASIGGFLLPDWSPRDDDYLRLITLGNSSKSKSVVRMLYGLFVELVPYANHKMCMKTKKTDFLAVCYFLPFSSVLGIISFEFCCFGNIYLYNM